MDSMNQIPLYPLRFEPIYQYRLWGGRRLADVLTAPLPAMAPSAKRGYSATAMTTRASLPMDRSKAGLSVNCLRIGRSRCWENWPGDSADSLCC